MSLPPRPLEQDQYTAAPEQSIRAAKPKVVYPSSRVPLPFSSGAGGGGRVAAAPVPSEQLLEIYAHLGTILVQTAPQDDQIIIDHVRSAHALTRKLVDQAQAAERRARLAAALSTPDVYGEEIGENS